MAEVSNEQLVQMVQQLQQELQQFKQLFAVHQHDDIDGTNHLRKNIILDQNQGMCVGVGSMLGQAFFAQSAAPRYIFTISDGEDNGTPPTYNNKSINAQFDITHQPLDVNKVSWIEGVRPPLYKSIDNKRISVTSGGNTVTIDDWTFATDELTGALINIYDSNGVFQESQQIASNTAHVVTIVGTWINTTNDGFFIIYVPMYVGISEVIWQRVYVQEGTPGGVRFGMGTTGGGQNGLLYMDAVGDLYWRDKAGVSVKLN